MKKICLIVSLFSLSTFSNAQFSQFKYGFWAKDFSKEQSLYKAKKFVMENILGKPKNVIKFEIYPLAAASSGQLTSLVYKCDDLNKEGLVLGFYGDRWNEAGVSFQSYAFKNIPTAQAIDLLSKLDSITDVHFKYLAKDDNNNNIYYQFDDMVFLMYRDGMNGIILRVQWEGFDSIWEWVAVNKTQKRLLKKLE